MRRYLLDSNALNAYVYRRKGVRDRALERRNMGGNLGTCIPVAAEILAGAAYSDSSELNLAKVETALNFLTIWPFDLAAAREYSRLYAELRRTGIATQPIDLMIAAIAFNLPNCTVVTCDSDFSRVPGLKVENWES